MYTDFAVKASLERSIRSSCTCNLTLFFLYFQTELQRTILDLHHLSVINRNLFNGDFHDSLPRRLQVNPHFVLEEFERFYPKYENILDRTERFMESAFGKQKNMLAGILELQRRLIPKKALTTLFLKIEVSLFATFIHVRISSMSHFTLHNYAVKPIEVELDSGGGGTPL